MRLKIRSEKLTPEQVTEALGISCDRQWHIGDRRGRTIIIEKVHGWILNSREPETAELEEHIRSVLLAVEPQADVLVRLSASSTVEMSCVMYSDRVPALYFDTELIQRIARLGAGLDIDLYILPS